jgi:hypothetical protein
MRGVVKDPRKLLDGETKIRTKNGYLSRMVFKSVLATHVTARRIVQTKIATSEYATKYIARS